MGNQATAIPAVIDFIDNFEQVFWEACQMQDTQARYVHWQKGLSAYMDFSPVADAPEFWERFRHECSTAGHPAQTLPAMIDFVRRCAAGYLYFHPRPIPTREEMESMQRYGKMSMSGRVYEKSRKLLAPGTPAGEVYGRFRSMAEMSRKRDKLGGVLDQFMALMRANPPEQSQTWFLADYMRIGDKAAAYRELVEQYLDFRGACPKCGKRGCRNSRLAQYLTDLEHYRDMFAAGLVAPAPLAAAHSCSNEPDSPAPAVEVPRRRSRKKPQDLKNLCARAMSMLLVPPTDDLPTNACVAAALDVPRQALYENPAFKPYLAMRDKIEKARQGGTEQGDVVRGRRTADGRIEDFGFR